MLKGAAPGVIERPCNGLSSWSHLANDARAIAGKRERSYITSSVMAGKMDEIHMSQVLLRLVEKGLHFISALPYGFSKEEIDLCLFSSTCICNLCNLARNGALQSCRIITQHSFFDMLDAFAQQKVDLLPL